MGNEGEGGRRGNGIGSMEGGVEAWEKSKLQLLKGLASPLDFYSNVPPGHGSSLYSAQSPENRGYCRGGFFLPHWGSLLPSLSTLSWPLLVCPLGTYLSIGHFYGN